jgi:hypothetical protein
LVDAVVFVAWGASVFVAVGVGAVVFVLVGGGGEVFVGVGGGGLVGTGLVAVAGSGGTAVSAAACVFVVGFPKSSVAVVSGVSPCSCIPSLSASVVSSPLTGGELASGNGFLGALFSSFIPVGKPPIGVRMLVLRWSKLTASSSIGPESTLHADKNKTRMRTTQNFPRILLIHTF